MAQPTNPDLAGAPLDGEAQHAPDVITEPVVEPPKPVEPTMAEIIAAELGKVTQHLDTRFDEYDQKLEALKPKPEPVAPTSWQPKTWDDFPALVEQKGREAAEAIIRERDEAAAAVNAQAAETQRQIDTHIDNQVSELEKTGKLPPIGDVNAADDPGKLARQELFGFAAYLGTPNLASAQATLDALHSTGQKFDHKVGQVLQGSKPNPGKYAPVGSSSASGGSASPTGPTYKDIATLDTDELLRRFPNG